MTRPTSVVDNCRLRVGAYFLAGFEACRLRDLFLAIILLFFTASLLL
jgi:hypothetical protein